MTVIFLSFKILHPIRWDSLEGMPVAGMIYKVYQEAHGNELH